jgi:hypothetical protein
LVNGRNCFLLSTASALPGTIWNNSVINQRAILNFTPGPRGELCPLGEIFTPSFTPRDEHSLLFRRMDGWRENFTPRG